MMGTENGTPEDGCKKQREKRARAADGEIPAEVMFLGEPVTKVKKKGKAEKTTMKVCSQECHVPLYIAQRLTNRCGGHIC